MCYCRACVKQPTACVKTPTLRTKARDALCRTRSPATPCVCSEPRHRISLYVALRARAAWVTPLMHKCRNLCWTARAVFVLCKQKTLNSLLKLMLRVSAQKRIWSSILNETPSMRACVCARARVVWKSHFNRLSASDSSPFYPNDYPLVNFRRTIRQGTKTI